MESRAALKKFGGDCRQSSCNGNVAVSSHCIENRVDEERFPRPARGVHKEEITIGVAEAGHDVVKQLPLFDVQLPQLLSRLRSLDADVVGFLFSLDKGICLRGCGKIDWQRESKLLQIQSAQ